MCIWSNEIDINKCYRMAVSIFNDNLQLISESYPWLHWIKSTIIIFRDLAIVSLTFGTLGIKSYLYIDSRLVKKFNCWISDINTTDSSQAFLGQIGSSSPQKWLPWVTFGEMNLWYLTIGSYTLIQIYDCCSFHLAFLFRGREKFYKRVLLYTLVMVGISTSKSVIGDGVGWDGLTEVSVASWTLMDVTATIVFSVFESKCIIFIQQSLQHESNEPHNFI